MGRPKPYNNYNKSYYNNNQYQTTPTQSSSATYETNSFPSDSYSSMSVACSNPQKRRKINLDSIETAYIFAGHEEKKFLFHKSMLCDTAAFFKVALEGPFKEAAEGIITMPEESADVVRSFQSWAYTGFITINDEEINAVGWEAPIKLYLFAQRYDIPDLQNCTIDLLAKQTPSAKVLISCLPLVYSNTSSTSPIRRFITDLTAQRYPLDQFFIDDDPDAVQHPQSFLIDLNAAQYKLRKSIIREHNWQQLGCTFHVHPSKPTQSEPEGTSQIEGTEGTESTVSSTGLGLFD